MSISKRANGALLAKLGAAAISYGFTVLLARLLTPDAFGQVVFFLNAGVLCAVIGAGGQHLALLRFLPGLTGFGQHRQFAATARAAGTRARKGTLWVAGAFVIFALCARQLGGLSGFSLPAIFLGAGLVLMIGWVDFLAHFARAINRIQLSLWPKELMWRSIAAGLVVAVALVAGVQTLTAELVLALLVLSLAILCACVARSLGMDHLSTITPAPPHGEWARTRTPFWINSVSNIFLANADVVAVGLLFGATQAGVYFLANRLAMLLAFFMVAHNVVIAPAISRRFHHGQMDQIERLACRAARKMTVPTVALGLVLIGMADPILALFGPGFSAAAPILWVLVGAGIINAAMGPSDIILNLCGEERAAMRISAVSLGLSGVLIVGCGLAVGPLGVAVGVLIAAGVRKIMFAAALANRLGMRADFAGGTVDMGALRAGS